MPIAYLDSSAIVKLVVREAETAALRQHLLGVDLISSEIASVEVPRAAHLTTGDQKTIARAEAILRRFHLVVLDSRLYRAAARLQPSNLRSLDAIHLASALSVRRQIDAVVVYDQRLRKAATDAGLRVEVPPRD